MPKEPTRAFWRADPKNPYYAVLQDSLWSGSDVALPSHPAGICLGCHSGNMDARNPRRHWRVRSGHRHTRPYIDT